MRDTRLGSALSYADSDEPAFAACSTSLSDRDDGTDETNDAPAGEASEEAVLWAQVGRLGTADPRPIDLFRPSPRGSAAGPAAGPGIVRH